MPRKEVPRHRSGTASVAGSLVQQGNLRCLEAALREHWSLGQNIVLCWTPSATGVDILLAPHYFLGRFSATLNDCPAENRLEALNGAFIRQLIAGPRVMTAGEFQGTARRLELAPRSIALPAPLAGDDDMLAAVDALIRRYSISHVESRAVVLLDIADFSLFTPFEQTSQLSSLSYSLNSAYSKLLRQNIELNFARSTTGDGFYVWSRDPGPRAGMHLFQLMLLLLADNAIARDKAQGNTVPRIRAAFHVGSHYEFYQAEGLNPTMYSYIVGDVTIELARILHTAQPGQIMIGDFQTRVPTSMRESAYLIEVDSVRFVERARKLVEALRGVELSGEEVDSIHCFLTGEPGSCGGETVRRYRIVDKHGRARVAYNLRVNIHIKNRSPLLLGSQEGTLPASPPVDEPVLLRARRPRRARQDSK